MRLTLINQFYAPDISPTAQMAASLAEHRAARGDEVSVITGRAGYLEGLTPVGSVAVGPALRLRRVWTPDLGKSSRIRRVVGYVSFSAGTAARLVVLRRQDVIITMTTPPLLVTIAVLHRLLHRRCRVILWSMDCYPDAAERFGELTPGGRASRLLRAVNRWALRHVEVVVGLDGAMVELLQSQYATDPARPRFTIIPNWERLALFPDPELAATAAWAGYEEIEINGRAVVVYLGNTGIGHRFDTVLDAAAQLVDEAVFLFVGGGARWSDLEREVRRRQLTNVVLQGYVAKEQTPAVMAGADAALIALDDRSLGVMSPSKLHANLAAGLPIVYVGPERSNVDEAILAYSCGSSLRHGDVAGVIRAVRHLRTDPTERQRSRQAFEKAYCDEATLPAFDALLDDG